MTAKVSSISGESYFKIYPTCANLRGVSFHLIDNNLGGWYSYRMSKTALNMATKNLAIELGRGKSKVICVVLHPGKFPSIYM